MQHIFIGSCLILFTSGLMAADKAPKAGKKPAAAKPAAAAPAAEAPSETSAPIAKNSTPSASSNSSASWGGAKYGMGGCGLGGLVIPSNEMLPQLGATFLNGIASNQTYGISSGTSNCVEARTEMAAMEQEVYFTANLSSLSKEAAQGSGEHIEALAEVFGCQQEADKVRLGQLSQNHYSELFAKPEPELVLERYLTVVNADPQLAKSCTKAS